LTLALKRTIVQVGLVLLTLWPGVHIWLVKSYGVSAWKLGGWGMYAVPRPKFLGMEVFFREQGASELQRLRAPSPPTEAAAKDFIERYRWLGRLAFPRDFTRAVLAMNPNWQQVRVVVYQPSLVRESGMMVMRQDRFDESVPGAPN
jgi:hypothetical protein